MTWPDIVIAGILLLATLNGFKRGLVKELAGLAALAAASWAALAYPGTLDATVAAVTHANPGWSHGIGMAIYGIAAYVLVAVVFSLLNRVAKLPLIGLVNNLLGAVAGALKGVLLAWIALYALLFLPLTRDIRADLHRSTIVPALAAPNEAVDGTVQANLPEFARKLTAPFFEKHHV